MPYLPLSKAIPCAAGTSVAAEAAVEDQADLDDTEETYEVSNSDKRDLKAEALSIEHLTTHLPKNPHCAVCMRAKLENVKSRRKGGVAAREFKEFGDHVTADTIVLHGLKDRGVGNKNDAIVLFDLGTGWLSCHPIQSRTEEETLFAYREFLGTKDKIKSFYSDSAPELMSCAKKMNWCADTSTPGMPRTNSIAESKVKLVINGARCLLLQAGLPSKFWPYAVRAFCNGINFKLVDGESCYFRRRNEHFHGKTIPFGCLIDYFPTKRTYRKNKSSSSKTAPADDDEHELADEEEENEPVGVNIDAQDEKLIMVISTFLNLAPELFQEFSLVIDSVQGGYGKVNILSLVLLT